MNKERDLIIVGTGLFSEVARTYFEQYSSYRVVSFACHHIFMESNQIHGLPLSSIEDLPSRYPSETTDVFIAIGYADMNKQRQRVYEEIKAKGYSCASFGHPNVYIWDSTLIGDNVFIFEDNTIQPYTEIGSDTVLWSGNHVGHHSKIGKHCFISSHVVISGSCEIGNRVFIGVNATLRDSIKIADETLIGAGALIMKNTKVKEVYITERTKPHKLTSDKVGF